jgi:hypothetical protein
MMRMVITPARARLQALYHRGFREQGFQVK